MALIEELRRKVQQFRYQEAVDCTYDVLTDEQGQKYLQILTYGSKDRDNPGVASQNIRFGPTALSELKRIFQEHNL